MNPHKLLKEEFVSNLDGTSKSEIAALSAAIPALVILRMCGNSSTKNCFLDFMVVVLPTLLLLTVLADYVYPITAAILLLMLLALRYRNSQQLPYSNSSSKKPFLTNYRFTMMLVTCVSILAVDFTIFPRRYAKTETYGTGLMDLGVGSFVVANAIVSKQARSLTKAKGSSLRSLSPLLALGILRLVFTKGVDYQVHVGEYGVHWNFFFTLAAVSLITLMVPVPAAYSGALGFGIVTVYQSVLLFGLNSYLMSPERGPDFISLNKEGVFSIFGYWGLYLLSLQLGRRIFLNPGNLLGKEKESKWFISAEIWLFDAFLWVVVVLLDTFVERVSRRTCNMAYVMFILAQNVEVIGLFSLAESFFPGNLALVELFDANLLLTFLVANLLTGLVNMQFNTLSIEPTSAFLILVMYLALLSVAMVVVQYGKKIKGLIRF